VKRRVLIADDDASIRLLIVTFLQRHGFEVRQARDGQEALEEMRACRIDLVLMDLMMPLVSGWEVLTARAAEPLLRRIPVVVITAMNRDRAVTGVDGKGVWDVLGKPFDLDKLLATVTTCLENPDVPAAPLAA
jgi:CheY-like chemotaxis protein